MKTKIVVLLITAVFLLASCQSEETSTQEAVGETIEDTAQTTPTAQVDFPEGDPRNILGAPDGVDTFDTNSHWTLFNNDCFQSNITDGQFLMTAKGMQGVSCWTFSWPLLHNFYIETEAVMPDICQPNDRYGMIYRAPDNHRGYLYGLTCDGQYYLNLFDGTNTTELVAASPNPTINNGAGAINRMGVTVFGNEHVLFINGVRLATAYDDTYLNPGKIGYFVHASTTSPFTSAYNELAVWSLDDDFQLPDTENPPSTTPLPPSTEGAPSVTTTTYVNVRSGPSTLYPVYFVAPPGGTGEVIGQSQDGQWWVVKLPAEITPTEGGWVSGDYTVLSNPNNIQIPVIPVPPVPPGVTFPPPDADVPTVTTTDAVNARSGPNNTCESYGVSPIGATAQAVGISDDSMWYAVVLPTDISPTGIGWVNANYVTTNNTENIPVMESEICP